MHRTPSGRRSGAGSSDALFASLYNELHRLARREAARAGPGAVAQRDHAVARGLSRHGPARRAGLPRPRPIPRLCGAGDANGRDRSRARRRGAEARRRSSTSLRSTRRPRRTSPSAEMLSEIGEALDELAAGRARTRQRGRPEVLLRLRGRRDRGDARRLRAHRPAQVGKGAVAAVQSARRAQPSAARRHAFVAFADHAVELR